MNIDQLHAFLHVAELGSQSRAAERLHVTQPALSRRLRELEASLGVALFRRTGRGVALTPAGAELRRRAAPLVGELDRLAQDLAADSGVLRGEVRLATPPSVGVELAGEVVAQMRSEHPEVKLCVSVALTGEIREGLLRGELDLGVLYHPVASAQLHTEPLFREELALVSRPSQQPGSEGVPVSLREALGLPLILPARQHGLRALLELHALRLGLVLDVVVEANSLRLLSDLVSRGLGHTLLPARAVQDELRAGRLCTTRLRGSGLRRESVLCSSRDRPLAASALEVAARIRREARKQRTTRRG
ncbi:MAG: LysR family transcriptional regulator [Myxococcales bacterium]|nr:LysR family transcriptional regulator [Myxococcales bacterium]